MNGWQRFGLLILGCALTLILFPDYEAPGWLFIFIMLLGGAAVLVVLSVLSNIFAIYRFELLNTLITLVYFGAVMYILLWNFPLTQYRTPIEQLKAGRHPTQEDIKRGFKRVTFNFDFVHRNVRRNENFVNQEIKKEKSQEPKKAPAPKPKPVEDEQLEITVE